ncbi:MAG: hypothetical protein WAL75_17040 [Terracidiphilus sp.]
MRQVLKRRSKLEADWRERIVPALTAAVSIMLSGGVVAAALYLLLGLASLASESMTYAQSVPIAAGVQLEAGIEKEDVDGDLKSAMDIYQNIAADTSAPRDLRAKALLRLGGCEEKLGRQAKQVYQQIVRDYADQPAATQARKRLAMLRQQQHPAPPATMSMRKIDREPLGDMGPADTDGERAIYSIRSQLYFGDLAGHSRHLIGDFPKSTSTPSKDFSMVVLNLKVSPTRPRHTLAVIKTDGTGYRELIRDDEKNSIFGITSSFHSIWSWDNKYIEICDFNPWSNLHGQVWIVSVADGQRRVLVDQGDGWVRRAAFSPNGQFVAYEAWPMNDLVDQTSRIFVVPIQGGEPRLVYESARWNAGNAVVSLLDWTADGRYLAVHDVRQGESALYLMPIKNGAASGDAAFLRYGEVDDGYTTAAGALVFQDNAVHPANVYVAVASIEPDGHLGTWRPLDLNARKDPWPSFSPDGKQIAYVGLAPDPTHRSLFVRDLAKGQDREIYQTAYGSLLCQYSMHNPKVFCSVEKEKGETELFSVEVESGAVEHIATFPQPRYLLRCGWDDQTFYFSPNGWRWGSFDPPIIQWSRSADRETVIAEEKGYYQMPSPDGRLIVRLRDGTLSVRTISGGDWVPLVSGIGLNRPVFATPDGKWAIYLDKVADWKIGLFRVPTTGGEPQLLGGAPANYFYYGELFFSPDSRQVLIWRDGTIDLWLLEKFEPPEKK